jgi:hypothetical protein
VLSLAYGGLRPSVGLLLKLSQQKLYLGVEVGGGVAANLRVFEAGTRAPAPSLGVAPLEVVGGGAPVTGVRRLANIGDRGDLRLGLARA